MDYYQPKWTVNQFVLLPIQLIGFKINFLWPLQEHATRLQRFFRIFAQTCSLVSYVATLLAEMTFIKVHFYEVSLLIEATSSAFLGIQYSIRIFLLGLRQKRMRQFLAHFYKEICFTSANNNRAFYGKVSRTMRIIGVITILYCSPMVLKFISLTIRISKIGLYAPNKPFVFLFIFAWYDAQAPVAFIITTIYTAWHPFSFLSLRAAEDYLLCLILIHTSYRYKELQQELRDMLSDARLDAERVEGGMQHVHAMFHKRLRNVFQRQQRLDIFVNMTKSYLSYHVFYCISFGVAMLCVVCFRIQMFVFDEEWFRFCSFFISQTMQILMLGYFGQILLNETSAMQASYYMCEWEQLLEHGDASSNKALMKDIKLAILHAEDGSVLIGMKMFPLTHTTVLWVLRKAASYFMFLKTMHDAEI